MNDLPEAIERLEKRLEALEQRVQALEHPLAAHWPHPSPELEKTIAPQAGSATPLAPALSMFSVLGRAMLGIAGAYVLRAVEEVSSVPKLAVASAGILYAFLWLVWAARARGGPRQARSVYAATSALILAPMLWELSLRFNLLPAPMSAVVVCGYGLAAVGLAWKRDLKPVLRVACIAATGLALALAIGSHAILPFAAAMLVLAAACEFTPGLDRVPEVRALVALAADAAIWILIYVYFSPQPAREDYPVLSRAALLAPGVAIFVLFTASVIVETVLRARPITVFETVQATITFLLAAVSVVDFGPPRCAILLGIACLALSAACYAAVFTGFERTEERRNATVFTAWGAALLLAGSYLCLPLLAMIVLLSAAAIAAMIVGNRRGPLALEFYGMVFLVAATVGSGLLSFLISAWIGTPPGSPGTGVWLAAASAVLCYAASKHGKGEAWKAQTLHLAVAALAAGAVAALLVEGLTGLAALRVQPGAHHLAFIRTLTLCTVALALAYGGARWRRAELTRLGHGALALVALKLVTEDLRHGHLAYIAASIFLVALTLIAAPRVARAKQKALGG